MGNTNNTIKISDIFKKNDTKYDKLKKK